MIRMGKLKDKVYTLEEARAKGWGVYNYDNGDYEYTDNNNISHLIGLDGVQKCEGNYVHSYPTGDYMYIDNNYIAHLIGLDKIQKCEGKDIFSYKNGDYWYIDKQGKKHHIKIINGEKYERVSD